MSKTVYLQTKNDGQAFDGLVFAAFEGFSHLGYEPRFFTATDAAMGAVKPTPETPVVGTTDTVRAAWGRMGIASPAPIDYPEPLHGFLGRKVEKTTLGMLRVRALGNSLHALPDSPFPTFLKPASTQKLFTGYVANFHSDLTRVDHLPSETEIWTSDRYDWLTEMRVFVYQGKIIHAACYDGDPSIGPDRRFVQDAINRFQSSGKAPVAYTADFGLGRHYLDYRDPDIHGHTYLANTMLIEVNDFWAIGSYTLGTDDYARMLAARWQEVCQTPR